MAQQTINIGTTANDGTGDPLRDAFDKANDNFTELYTDKADAATVTTALAAKAPLASPTFTGTPAAPTPSAGDNSTKVATTAYVDTALAAKADAAAVSTQSGTSYTFVLSDAGDYVRCSNASAITATLPPNSSVAFPVGTTLAVEQAGAGQVTVAAGSGVTLRVAAAHVAKTREQYAVAQAIKVATDEWVLYGNLEEAP